MVSLISSLFVSASVEAFVGCKSNFIGRFNKLDTAPSRRGSSSISQLQMNLPGQVSKKVIVTGAGELYYMNIFVNNMHMHIQQRVYIYIYICTNFILFCKTAGRTGSLVFSLLDTDPHFDVVGLVRSESSAKKLVAKTNCLLEEVVISDVTQMSFDNIEDDRDSHPWPYALDNAEAMVICTSAVPQISKLSLIKAMMKIPTNMHNYILI